MQMKFKLTRRAKNLGGDRYEHGNKEDQDFMVIYIPQFISRDSSNFAKEEITVTFE